MNHKYIHTYKENSEVLAAKKGKLKTHFKNDSKERLINVKIGNNLMNS